jgi:hypothetical protein
MSYMSLRPFNNYQEFLTSTKLGVGSIITVETDPQLTEWRQQFTVMILGYSDSELILPKPIGCLSFTTLFYLVRLVDSDGTTHPLGMEE